MAVRAALAGRLRWVEENRCPVTSGALAEPRTEEWKTKADGRALLGLTILLRPRVGEGSWLGSRVPSVLFLCGELGRLLKLWVNPT